MGKSTAASLASKAQRKSDLLSELKAVPAPSSARRQWINDELRSLADVPNLSRSEIARVRAGEDPAEYIARHEWRAGVGV